MHVCVRVCTCVCVCVCVYVCVCMYMYTLTLTQGAESATLRKKKTVLETFNGQKVLNLRHLHDLVLSCSDEVPKKNNIIKKIILNTKIRLLHDLVFSCSDGVP